MSNLTRQETPREEAAARMRGSQPGPRLAVCVGCVLAGHLPLVALHFDHLLRYRPYLRFFPVLLAVVAWLVWQRWPRDATAETRLTRLTSRFLLLLGLGCLAASILLLSPPLGGTAAVLSLGGLVLRLKGRAALQGLIGVWLLLWLLVPPVLHQGDRLVRLMHGFTAQAGSWILESLQANHDLAGNVFLLPERQLFVAEACNALHSQLLLVTLGMLVAILRRRTFLHGVLLTVAAAFWSLAINTTRVVIVVLAAARWDMDLASGWQHEVLGVLFVLLGLLLVLSSDRWLAGMLAPVLLAWAPETQADPFSRLWNKFIARYRNPRSRKKQPEQPPPPPPGTPRHDHNLTFWAVPFACLGALQLPLLMMPQARVPELADAVQRDWLPARQGDWESMEYDAVERGCCSEEGRFSRSWRYQWGDREASMSVDFPFLGWHELARRYRDRGWTELNRAVLADDTGDIVAVELSAPSGNSGYLLFSLFDGAARPVKPGTTFRIAAREKLAQHSLPQVLEPGGLVVWSPRRTLQIRLLITARYPLTEQERRSADTMYIDLRRRLLQRWQAEPENGQD